MRTTYCKLNLWFEGSKELSHLLPAEDERVRRRGYSSDVVNAIPLRSDISDPTTVAEEPIIPRVSAAPNRADGTPPPVDTVTPSDKLPNEDHLHFSSPTPVIEVQPQPVPASAPESNDQAALFPHPLDTPQQSPSNITSPTTPAASTPGDITTTTGISENQPTNHTNDQTTIQMAIPTLPVVFTFDGSSKFITSSALAYWETIPGGQAWVDMVNLYLQLEHLPTLPGVRDLFNSPDCVLIFPQCPLRLPTTSRPAELSTWMKGRSFTSNHLPYIDDTDAYSRTWIAWWTTCQPSWRQHKGWPLPREEGRNVNWGKLGARGQNGIFIVVMSTTWWAACLKPTDNRVAFDEAVDDIRWVIGRILESLLSSAPGAMEAADNASPRQVAKKPTSTATWQARGDGKRQSKPSRKLLEALS